MIQAIIVDDEESGITVLQKLIEKHFPEVSITGIFNTIAEAEKAVRESPPDILFLDIHMPEGSGFTLIENIGKINFSVVFVTAYNQYALKALKMSATDYLLKPINRNDLQLAIEKSLRYIPFYKEAELNVSTLLQNLSTANVNKNLVTNKLKGDSVALNQIICITADINYSIIHTDTGRITIPRSLKELDEALCDDTYNFIRIHKSVLINRDKIIRTETHKNMDTIYLKNDFSFQVSKRKKEEIRQILFKIKQN